MITSIIKRDGRETVFDQTKIADAIEKAFQASGAMQDRLRRRTDHRFGHGKARRGCHRRYAYR